MPGLLGDFQSTAIHGIDLGVEIGRGETNGVR